MSCLHLTRKRHDVLLLKAKTYYMNVKLDLINLKMSYFQCFDLIKGRNKAETAHRRSNEAEICSKRHKHQRNTLYHNLIKKHFLTELINTLSCTGQNRGVYSSLGQWRTDVMFLVEMTAIQLKPQTQVIPQAQFQQETQCSPHHAGWIFHYSETKCG